MNKENNVDLENLYSTVSKVKQKVYEGWIQRYVSEILLNRPGDHVLEAEQRIQEAIAADQRNGMNWHLARDYLSYADLLIKKGDRLKAQEILDMAIETFKECGPNGWVERAERKLAEIA